MNSTAREVLAGIEYVCRTAPDAITLYREVGARLGRAVRYDRWCALLIDPETLYATGGILDEGLPAGLLPRLVDLEIEGSDSDTVPKLARDRITVSTVDRATAGRLDTSQRYAEVLQPAGLGRELRAVLTDAGSTWGSLILHRASSVPDFTNAELALIAGVAAPMGRGVRRCLLLSNLAQETAERESLDSPGLAILNVAGPDVVMEIANEAARRWMRRIPSDKLQPSDLPVAVAVLASRARRGAQPVSTRLRTHAGCWINIHAELVEPAHPMTGLARVSLVIEATRSHELAEVVAQAYGLTPRERDIALLTIKGHSNQDIAALLWLSPWTVQGYLKEIFRKLKVHSRGELATRMFFH